MRDWVIGGVKGQGSRGVISQIRNSQERGSETRSGWRSCPLIIIVVVFVIQEVCLRRFCSLSEINRLPGLKSHLPVQPV